MLIACFAPDNERSLELLDARMSVEKSSPTNALRRWSEEMFERCSNPTANGVITIER
jgi:hypothetical protein